MYGHLFIPRRSHFLHTQSWIFLTFKNRVKRAVEKLFLFVVDKDRSSFYLAFSIHCDGCPLEVKMFHSKHVNSMQRFHKVLKYIIRD